jgi:hypothetical protein
MTNIEKPRRARVFGKILGKIFGSPAVRGTLKSFPVGGWLYEVVAVVKHILDPKKRGQPLPHSPVSLLVQAVWLFLILYGVFTKQIHVEKALDYFDFSADDFKHFFSLTDTTAR